MHSVLVCDHTGVGALVPRLRGVYPQAVVQQVGELWEGGRDNRPISLPGYGDWYRRGEDAVENGWTASGHNSITW